MECGVLAKDYKNGCRKREGTACLFVFILVLKRNPDRRVKVVDDRQDIKNHEAQANDDGNCPADGCTYPIWKNRVAGHSYDGEDDKGSQYLQGKRE